MKSFFLFCCLFLFAFRTHAKPSSDSILVYHNVMGFQFYKNNQRLEKLEAIKTLSTQRVVRTEYYHASTSCFLSNLAGGLGGGLLGWQFVKYIDRQEANAVPVGIGLGLVIGSVILHTHGIRRMANAVYLYNEGISSSKSKTSSWRIEPLVNNQGVGIAMHWR